MTTPEQREIIDALKQDGIGDVSEFVDVIKQASNLSSSEKKSIMIWVSAFSLLLAVLLSKKIITKDEADAIVLGAIAATEKTMEEQARGETPAEGNIG